MTYLQYLHNLFDDDWLLALAAYNAGEGFLAKRIAQSRAAGKPGDFWSLKLREETYNYVPKLLALADLVKNPQHYGINLLYIPNRPYFEKILLDAPIELSVLAQAADLSTTELGHLNPAFRRSITPPNGPFTVLIPVDHSVELRRFLASADRSIWRAQSEYAVVAGDTLSGIAQRHHVRTNWIKQANKLQSDQLSIGQILLMPHPENPLSAGTSDRSTRYRVIAGDTLSGIAEKFNTPLSKLRRNNDLTSDVVRIGQTLKLPSSAERPAAVRKVLYRVKSGDSLSVIANAFGVKISDIVRWNGIKRSDILKPRQRLLIVIDPHLQ
jgi:membrane-bound lytic murein transglycosylase D